MQPPELVQEWVKALNRADAEALSRFYAEDATNHQVPEQPVVGRDNICRMFETAFAQAEMTRIVDNFFQDGEWAILEWHDPPGLRGLPLPG